MTVGVLLQGLLHVCVWFDHPENEDAHLTFDAEFFGYFFMWVAHAIAQYQRRHGVSDHTAPLSLGLEVNVHCVLITTNGNAREKNGVWCGALGRV